MNCLTSSNASSVVHHWEFFLSIRSDSRCFLISNLGTGVTSFVGCLAEIYSVAFLIFSIRLDLGAFDCRTIEPRVSGYFIYSSFPFTARFIGEALFTHAFSETRCFFLFLHRSLRECILFG